MTHEDAINQEAKQIRKGIELDDKIECTAWWLNSDKKWKRTKNGQNHERGNWNMQRDWLKDWN